MALVGVLTLAADAQLYGVHSWLESESHRGTSLVVQCLRLCSQCRGLGFDPCSEN